MRGATVYFALQPLHSLRKAPGPGQQVDEAGSLRPLVVRCDGPAPDTSQRTIVAPSALPATGAIMTRWVQDLWGLGSEIVDPD